MKDLINIAIVDDESLFVEGITLLFSEHKNISVTIAETDATRFLKRLSKLPIEEHPDIVLIDLQMEPMDGFELVEEIKKIYEHLKIIILSSHYKQNVFGHMIKMGVSAFLPKNAKKQDFIMAIGTVHKTGIYFSHNDHEMLKGYLNSKQKRPSLISHEELSPREIDVLKLICKEYTNQEIAEKLFLSVRTIESHRQNILDKTGAKNTVGIVLYAILNNIHPLPPRVRYV
ncbi:response regulator [Joostella sp.]|uniref:response regulator transcription factor n=1 Tax=Joostella sp. TaxID=2231138 RepID=UPI003A9019D3